MLEVTLSEDAIVPAKLRDQFFFQTLWYQTGLLSFVSLRDGGRGVTGGGGGLKKQQHADIVARKSACTEKWHVFCIFLFK